MPGRWFAMTMKKKFLYGTLVGLLVFTIALYGLSSTHIVHAATSFPENSSIGGVPVGGLTEEEATSLLISKIDEWKGKGEVIVYTEEQSITIPYENIKINIQDAIHTMKTRTKKPWYKVFSKTSPQQLPLIVTVDLSDNQLNELEKTADVKGTIKLIENSASYLGEHEITAVPIAEDVKPVIVTKDTWEIPEDYIFLQELMDELNGLTISSNEDFSYLDAVANQVSYYGEDEGNFIASMLYTLLLQTNVQFVERHSQGVVPSYTAPGLEADVSIAEDKDLIVHNPGPNEYTISIEQTGNKLNMSLQSKKLENTYKVKLENSKTVDFRTITRYNKDLQPGHKQVLQKGKKGKRVEVYRIMISPDGEELEKELISRDFYLPQQEIVLAAPAVEATSDETATDGTIDENASNLEDGGLIDSDTNASEVNDQTEDELVDGANSTDQEDTTDDLIYEQPNIVK